LQRGARREFDLAGVFLPEAIEAARCDTACGSAQTN
jgi:hypothetical protein